MTPTSQPLDRKLFAGARLKRVRLGLGLTQTSMAEALEVSVSYLNLIERNQRPMSAQFLLKLAQTFEVDLRVLTTDHTDGLESQLKEILRDPLFRGLDFTPEDSVEATRTTPNIVEALTRLYAAYQAQTRSDWSSSAPDARQRASAPALSPLTLVRDYIQAQANHFPALEEQAETLAEELRLSHHGLWSALCDRLRARHAISVRILPVEIQPESLRRYDFHSRQLRLSELLSPAARNFALGYQLALIEAKASLDALIAQADLPDEASQRLLRINLANYFAAALLMPYGKFHAASEATGYDLMLLTARFGASFEQVCHRLTTLQRPTARGIPFSLLRVDEAGNVSKRFAASHFPFAKQGGSCALWSLHQSFRTPGTLLAQIVELPEGERYFSLACAIPAPVKNHKAIAPHHAIALMCALRYAPLLTYARGLDLETPDVTRIGPSCALCTQADCRQRNQPPLHKTMMVDLHSKTASPFRFE